METIFYVVRTTLCAYIYGNIQDAKAIAAVMFDATSNRVVIIERYEMVCELKFSSKYVRYCKHVIATSESYRKATEHERKRLIAQALAKSREGFALAGAYVFSADGQGHYFGSLNGKPADCSFLAKRPLKYVEHLAIILNR